ncbi:hypothetical protein [Fusobacterium ulcerans]|uniref:hypothetical protein n=1 Tax=Fusobacterium ulcerans TaxID=861 RepID=UPI001032BA23|nr:hypothetical protein [Fusobacterium ulcerans]
MKKKLIYLFIIMLLFTGCTYFKVREAFKEADKGEYTKSLYNLAAILKNNSEDRRTLDAFELIYPMGEKEYYDKLDMTRNRDLTGYTKALLNLLRVQEIYYSLPEESRNSIAIITPPSEERNKVRQESAESFFKLGNGFQAETIEDKLRKFGFYSEAKKYDIDNRKDINKKYSESMEDARVRFNLVVNVLAGRKNFSDDFKKYTISNIGTYPLFTVNDKSKANVDLDISLSNFYYFPPSVNVISGIDSYFETRIRRVMKKVVITEMVNGKAVERVKYVPVDEEYEVEIFYKYEKYIKTTYAEYDLAYILKEKKDNRVIAKDSNRIRYTDEVVWMRFYPITHIKGGYHRFPISENEKYVLDEATVVRRAMLKGTDQINSELKTLDSNRIIGW